MGLLLVLKNIYTEHEINFFGFFVFFITYIQNMKYFFGFFGFFHNLFTYIYRHERDSFSFDRIKMKHAICLERTELNHAGN